MRRWLISLVSSLAFTAWAQDPVPLDGNWTAKWSTDKGVPAHADVVIKGQEGTWHRLGGGSRADPCTFRQMPIAVRATAEEVILELQRSKALQGCEDTRFAFRRVDDKTLERTLQGGQTMRLTR